MPKVSLNDEWVEVAPDTSLQAALPLWHGMDSGAAPQGAPLPKRYVIAVNQEFVPRAEYASVILKDGDQIDLVRPVWGG